VSKLSAKVFFESELLMKTPRRA